MSAALPEDLFLTTCSACWFCIVVSIHVPLGLESKILYTDEKFSKDTPEPKLAEGLRVLGKNSMDTERWSQFLVLQPELFDFIKKLSKNCHILCFKIAFKLYFVIPKKYS